MIRTIPKKLTELGRIRIGWQEPNKNGKGKHPAKLNIFRLTSANKPLLHYAARLYGGDVTPWDDAPTPGKFELFTTANAIDVLIPTASAVSVSYEVWSGGGCQKRCNGCLITAHADISRMGQPCECPDDEQARTEAAKTGAACARILRLNVLLPDLPGMGVWRLESKGYYATSELMGTLEMLQGAGLDGTIIEAVLRLEERMDKKAGATRRYVVPVLWPKYTPRQILAGGRYAMIEAPAEEQKTLQEHISDLYGDRAPRQGSASADPIAAPAAHEPGQGSLKTKIDAIMEENGMSPAQQGVAWERWHAKYPDLTPAVLTIIYEGLEERVHNLYAQEIDAAMVREDMEQDREPGDEAEEEELLRWPPK